MTEVVKRDGIEQGFNTAGDAIGKGKTVEQLQTTYHTAVRVQKPRELAVVEKNCLTEAALAGEVCFYGWGAGKNRVEGPSIDCAMIAARNWGNTAIEMRPVHETSSSYIMEAAFIDLETGFTYSRQFKQSKSWTVYGKMDEHRKADIRFQIGQSKAQRNAILKSLPRWLIDKMIDKAKEGVREQLQRYIDKKGIEAARKLALDALAKLGVPLERIEYKYEKKYAAWDIEILITLKGDIRALSDGAESADSLFPEKEGERKPETNGLSTDDMSPGDAAKHQGYDSPPEQPESAKTNPDSTIKDLIALGAPNLVKKATTEMATIFADDLDAGEAFILDCLKKKVLADEILANNNAGQLAQFIVLMRKQKPAGKPGTQVGAGF